MPTIHLYTDGSSLGNPGPGGFAFAVFTEAEGKLIKKDAGGEPNTTNNRMEMMAISQGLNFIAQNFTNTKVEVFSDSRLVLNTLTKNWKRNQNLDIWAKIDQAIIACKQAKITISYNWVKGHAGNIGNELVDKMAQAFAREQGRNPNSNSDDSPKVIKKNPEQKSLFTENTPDSTLRNKSEEQIFFCSHCNLKTAGIFSQKTSTGPLRVDCSHCLKYIKFAKKI